MTWTDERVELLKKMWTDGLSAGQIARELGGVSRNAVVGKVHRLHLTGRVRPTADTGSKRIKARKPRERRRPLPSNPKPTPQRQKPTMLVLTALEEWDETLSPTCDPVPLLQLGDRMCRWAVKRENAEHRFCGQSRFLGFSYCRQHAKLAYEPAEFSRQVEKFRRAEVSLRNEAA